MSAMNNKGRKANKRRNGKSGVRYSGPQMRGAPAGVSQDLQQFTRFYPANKQGNIIMHTCAAISQVQRTDSSLKGSGLQPGSSGNSAMSGQLNLTGPQWLSTAGLKYTDDYVSPVFDLIASAFVRYRVHKLIFHYEPQASATTSERLVFAFAEDPMHPVLWNSTVPTQGSLLSLADSLAFAPWRGWSMDCSQKLDDTLYYTFSDPVTDVSSFPERFSDFGVISCVSDSTTSQSNTVCGVLYMEIQVELVEFCPVTTVSPTAASRLLPKFSDAIKAGKKSGPPKASDVDKCKVCANLSDTVAAKLLLCPSCDRKL